MGECSQRDDLTELRSAIDLNGEGISRKEGVASSYILADAYDSGGMLGLQTPPPGTFGLAATFSLLRLHLITVGTASLVKYFKSPKIDQKHARTGTLGGEWKAL